MCRCGWLSHLSRSDHDAAEIRGDQIRRKSSRRRECHPAPQPAQGDGGKRTIDGRVMSHGPGAHPRLHAPCRRDDVDQALAALRADALATGFATRPSQSCGGRRQTVAALTSLRFLPRTSTSRSKTPTGLLARSTSGIPRCRKRHDGFYIVYGVIGSHSTTWAGLGFTGIFLIPLVLAVVALIGRHADKRRSRRRDDQ